jgi:hypothetical protein
MISMCGCTTTEQRTASRGCSNPETIFVGAVLDMYEENGYDDSDFIAVVWDADTARVTTRMYASTRGWTYHNGATVDATDDVIAAALAWYRAQWERTAIEGAYEQALVPVKGSVVRSLTTRGKNKGIEGTVVWVGEDGYARPWSGDIPLRYGIKVDGQEKLSYLPAHSVELIDPPAVDEAALRELATTVKPANWRSALMVGLSHRALARL